MRFKILLRASLIACALALAAPRAFADEAPAQTQNDTSGLTVYRDGIGQIIDRARDLIGIRYRRSGDKPQTGFDCSGLVTYVYREGLGLVLPHRSREISKEGMSVAKDKLEPGDLVFFNTMRHAFSHVGIYLGDHKFIHAPRTGETVRIDNLQQKYWAKRYNGARRVSAAAG